MYSVILQWLRVHLGSAIICLCLEGSCVVWRSGIGIDNGAGLPDVCYHLNLLLAIHIISNYIISGSYVYIVS